MDKYLKKEFVSVYILLILPFIFYFGVKLLVNYNSHTICIFKNITGNNCWGCGITRAFNELFYLNFKKAYEYNPRIIIIAPLLFYIWIVTLIREMKFRFKTIKSNSVVLEKRKERGLL